MAVIMLFVLPLGDNLLFIKMLSWALSIRIWEYSDLQQSSGEQSQIVPV